MPGGLARRAALGACAAALLAGGCDAAPRPTERPVERPARAGSEAPPGAHGPVLATVGARRITAAELADTLAEQEPYVQLRFSSPERKRRFLDELIKVELLANEARGQGLDRDPAVVRQVRRALATRLARELQTELVPVASLTEAEVATYYEQHRAQYQPRALAEVEQQVRNELLAEKRRAALRAHLAALRARAKLEIHPERLAGLQPAKAKP
ncbi:MAG: hypothetical protein IPG96_01090 [Proteobacteria bacterium]|nr:hypothetical protein [Pseudomonadota bacterium]